MRILFFVIVILIGKNILSQSSYTFEHNGLTRSYLLSLPNNLNEHSPLVFVLHGYGGNANNMLNLGWEEIAENNGVVICYPNGTTDFLGTTHWNSNLYTGDIQGIPEGVDDHDFLVSLSNHIQSTHQISSECVFSCGFSNGGFMSLSLACQESEHFKAVGSVGGLMSDYDYNYCNPSQSTPIIQLHGTSDATVNYYNGTGFPLWGSEGVESIIDFWADILQTTESITENEINNSSVDFIRKYGSPDNKELHHYRVNGQGHTWFGLSGNMGINATEVIWDFFDSYCETSNSINTMDVSISKEKTLLKKIDALGREVNHTTNQLLFHIYDDGSVEKKFIVE